MLEQINSQPDQLQQVLEKSNLDIKTHNLDLQTNGAEVGKIAQTIPVIFKENSDNE